IHIYAADNSLRGDFEEPGLAENRPDEDLRVDAPQCPTLRRGQLNDQRRSILNEPYRRHWPAPSCLQPLASFFRAQIPSRVRPRRKTTLRAEAELRVSRSVLPWPPLGSPS